MINIRLFGRRISMYYEKRDWWIGVYLGDEYIYICLLPTLVIRVERKKPMSIFGERRVFNIKFPEDDLPETRAIEVTVQEVAKLQNGKQITLFMKEAEPQLLHHLVQLLVFFVLAVALVFLMMAFFDGNLEAGFLALVLMSVIIWPYVA